VGGGGKTKGPWFSLWKLGACLGIAQKGGIGQRDTLSEHIILFKDEKFSGDVKLKDSWEMGGGTLLYFLNRG